MNSTHRAPSLVCLRNAVSSSEPLPTFVFDRWSTTRPGVPTMMCGRLASEMACAIISMPPTSTAQRTPIREPTASTCSAIWMASSRVGDSTSAYSSCGLSIRPCRMGRLKAPVLPDPVCASPITSLPACVCVCVCVYLYALHEGTLATG